MTRGNVARLHGYVVIDKPAGWTSHDVVTRVRRILGERRVGHAGTLDPAAVGVLPVAVGLATRTVEYLASAGKAYLADFTFGVDTDSADGDGTLIGSRDTTGLSLTSIQQTLSQFVGTQEQTPPMHAAIKVGGKRLYRLARQGREIDVPSRTVVIHALDVIDWRPPTLTVSVSCSKGTYIRALARDVGARVGTGAYLSHLVRTQTGPFSLGDAVTLDDLPSLLDERGWDGVAFHPDWVIQQLTALILDDVEAIGWTLGQAIAPRATVQGPVRVYDRAGWWLGIGDAGVDRVRPVKVVAPARAGAEA